MSYYVLLGNEKKLAVGKQFIDSNFLTRPFWNLGKYIFFCYCLTVFSV